MDSDELQRYAARWQHLRALDRKRIQSAVVEHPVTPARTEPDSVPMLAENDR